jgi:Na+/H+-dicarboxylate symporter
MTAFFRLSLAAQMAIATVLGIICGLFFGDYCTFLGPWGNAYVMILKITTIPYLISAIIHGIGKLASATAKEILQKGLIFIGSAWAINIGMIYLAVFLFPKSHGIPYSSYNATPPAPLDFTSLLIPDNVFHALANNIVPAVVVFGLLMGISLMHIKEKQPMMAILETVVDSLTRITQWVSRITPIGTFIIIAYQVGTIQLFTVKQVGTYLVLYILACCVVVFWIFPRLVSMLTSISAHQWIKDLFPILLLAYTTNVVIVTLPFIIELIKKEIENFYHKDGRIKDQIQGIVSIIFNLPLGSLFIAVFVFFISLFYHFPLGIGGQVQLFLTTFLTSLGALGLGSWINSLNFLLDTLGLPLDAIDLYLSTLPFTAGFQSMVSVIEISSISFLTALACHNLVSFRWHQFMRRAMMTAAPILVIALAIKIFNPFPNIANPAKTICDIGVEAPVKVTIYKPANEPPSPRSGDVFDRILRTKTLRVGYNIDAIPFCFENTNGVLAGYDIAFAYALAKDLGCDLELIPMNFGMVSQDLEAGYFDIGMSGISITEERLKKICFTDSYIDSRIVFVMRKKFSKQFTSVDAILTHPSMKVAVLRGTSYEALARSLFPQDRIVLVESYDDFAQYYPHAILMRGEPQAISWSLRYPNFTVVIPNPGIGQDSLAYPIKTGADRFLCFLNQWLKLKKNEEFTQQEYNLWILGKTDTVLPQEPRWSIIRNVLHWVE